MSLLWRLATERAKREAQLQRLEALLATPDDRAALRARQQAQALALPVAIPGDSRMT